MNILLVSQCSGNALKETRRILDQFAERRGDRTWQTPITRAGLDTLHALLRKTARKNSGIACHWIRGIDHSELLWIVGDARRFNSRGAVPTNLTKRNVLRRNDENDWHTLEYIYLLSALASLCHDLGKACTAFQDSLTSFKFKKNIFRHEWISLRLFQAFVGTDLDVDWLKRLANPTDEDLATWLNRLEKDGIDAINSKPTRPFEEMAPLAQAIGWLIVTHHRLPIQPKSNDDGFDPEILNKLPQCITAEWNETSEEFDISEIKLYWEFIHGLPVVTPGWKKKASQLAQKLLFRIQLDNEGGWLANPYIMHLARLSLMLADHTYSSLPSNNQYGDTKYPLYANTDRHSRQLKQRLDEHLLGVEALSGQVVHALPEIANNLPGIVRHRGLRKRSVDEKYHWQDKAFDLAESIRERSLKHGAFLVNMASTGSGKTLANARIMYAMSEPDKGMRCAFALGLRALTLQTGQEYRSRLALNQNEVAIRIGGEASTDLFDYFSEQTSSGSESSNPLLLEDGHVFYEAANSTIPILNKFLRDSQSQSMLLAPFLICTVDQLISATESTRGGYQIIPMLRLLSGDLVLDELDDYDIDDLSAIARLVYWAGLLGCRVLISSATLPPALVQGMFDAYREGRHQFQRNRGERLGELPAICGVWVDEFHCTEIDCADIETFIESHLEFVQERCKSLKESLVYRRGKLFPLKGDREQIRSIFAKQVLQGALSLHDLHHGIDPKSGKRVSFGLVRMANIDPLFDVAIELYKLDVPEGYRIHLCVYHSQFPLLIRSKIESQLDKVLNRHQPNDVFEIHDIRGRIDSSAEYDQLFIVLSSPVTEVGRDHDYDWAVVEPSSMRSLIQLAGRVGRHRGVECNSYNLLIFNRNLRSIENPDKPAYCRPGFENDIFSLEGHVLEDLLPESELEVIDARPRISKRSDTEFCWRRSLVDLEHWRLEKAMIRAPKRVLTEREFRNGASSETGLGAYTWWTQPKAMLSGVLQREQRFRKESFPKIDLVLMPNDDESDYRLFKRKVKGHIPNEDVSVEDSLNVRLSHEPKIDGVQPWNNSDYVTELKCLAEQLDIEDLRECARLYGTISLPDSGNGWHSDQILGFTSPTVRSRERDLEY